jgi:predicted O-methyltransferase YrrM
MKLKHLMWKEDGWGYLPANKWIFGALESVKKTVQPKRVLEIGFYAGHSTTYMAQIFGKDCEIISCCPDHPRGRAYGARVMKIFPNVTVHLTPSPQIYDRVVEEGDFDLVFVDGNHTYEQVIKDINVSLKLGARYILFDNTELPQVMEAIEFEVENGLLEFRNNFPYRTDFKGGGVGEMQLYETLWS